MQRWHPKMHFIQVQKWSLVFVWIFWNGLFVCFFLNILFVFFSPSPLPLQYITCVRKIGTYSQKTAGMFYYPIFFSCALPKIFFTVFPVLVSCFFVPREGVYSYPRGARPGFAKLLVCIPNTLIMRRKNNFFLSVYETPQIENLDVGFIGINRRNGREIYLGRSFSQPCQFSLLFETELGEDLIFKLMSGKHIYMQKCILHFKHIYVPKCMFHKHICMQKCICISLNM